MNASTRSNWMVPAALIALSVVPVAAGTVRLVQLGGGAEVTLDNARFFAAPLPLVLHVLSASVYCVLGALQFSPSFRRRRPGWHRGAGRLLVPLGLVAALSGLWLTQFYPPADHDGPLIYPARLVVGSAMVVSICLGVAAIRQRDIARHRAWMMRGYALGFGAGTQVLAIVPWMLFVGPPYGLSRDLLMVAAWIINVVVAEWLLRRRPSPSAQARATGGAMVAALRAGHGASERSLATGGLR